MNSKILTNEKEIIFDDGIKLYYGSTQDVICVTVKGKFKPKTEQKDYKYNIKNTKDGFNIHGNEHVSKLDWINKHYIFTSDFTECGIMFSKTCKWKFKMFFTPLKKKSVEDYRIHIIKLSEDMIDILEYYMNMNGFTMNR